MAYSSVFVLKGNYAAIFHILFILFMRIPWTRRRSNPSILKEISPEYSLEGLRLKLQYFGHLMRRADLLEKTVMLGKIEGGGEGDDRGLDG